MGLDSFEGCSAQDLRRSEPGQGADCICRVRSQVGPPTPYGQAAYAANTVAASVQRRMSLTPRHAQLELTARRLASCWSSTAGESSLNASYVPDGAHAPALISLLALLACFKIGGLNM